MTLGLLLFFFLLSACIKSSPNSFTVQIKARPTLEDQYCVAHTKPPLHAVHKRVIGFEPLPGWAAHHIILFICVKQPPSPLNLYDACSKSELSHPCGDIQFAWAHGGSSLWLPPSVGIYLSPDVSFALQVHYGFPTTPESRDLQAWTDESGVKLHLTDEDTFSTWHKPEVWFMGPRYFPPLPPLQPRLEVTGKTAFRTDISLFAIRVHAHDRGVYNEITFFHANGEKYWHYQRSTQLAQSFVPIAGKHILVRSGDYALFSCVYDTSSQTRTIQQGATKHDEMCNVYLMYFETPKEVFHSQQQLQPAMTTPRLFFREEVCLHQELSNVNSSWQIVGISADIRTRSRAFFFHRANRIWTRDSFSFSGKFNFPPIENDVIVEFNPETNRVIKSFGAGYFFLPHAIRVDPYFPNQLWLVDVGAHTVSTWDLTSNLPGKVVLGERHNPSILCKPTDVVLSASHIYVADGYCHHRVVKYSRHGAKMEQEFLLGLLSVPHALVLVKEWLIVADREHNRVLVVKSENGELVQEIKPLWDPDYFPYSVGILPNTGRLVLGLVQRFPNGKRQGQLWVSDDDSFARGRVVCNSHAHNLMEPHMMDVTGEEKILIAEAVDDSFSGKVLVVSL